MLDENLPTFRLKPASDNPLSSILYFTQNGSDPTAEYLLRRPDPALPASRNKYAIALCDPYSPDVVYGEVLVEPEWTQPTLSAAEIRAQAQAGAPPAPATAMVPDSFTIQLYNPDQTVAVKMVPGTWNKTDSWEFELPIQTFRKPTSSELDREQQNSSPVAADLIPRIMFRWKKDGLLSRDMTCFMSGKRLGARKSKEPDITIALFKAARESAVTVYEPNLNRVEVEDRKGLELVLLLGSEAIKELYLMPKVDLFNVQGGGPTPDRNRRKNSRLAGTSSPAGPAAMSGALANTTPSAGTIAVARPSQPLPTSTTANNTTHASSKPEIDAETRRLQAMVEREQREREKAERAEQKRIKKMLDEEENERRRREAEVAKETERLRKKYGVEGQELPSDRPPLPPRALPQPSPPPQPVPPVPAPHMQQQQHHHHQQLSPWPTGYWGGTTGGGGVPPPPLPPRPVSAGPYSRPPGQQGPQRPFHCPTLNSLWKGAAGQLQQLPSQVQAAHQQGGQRPGGRGRSDEARGRVQKKRSSHW
ncbi:hypothetical protein VTK56DRAFT_6869 [Thermocarpiscus australiensis]